MKKSLLLLSFLSLSLVGCETPSSTTTENTENQNITTEAPKQIVTSFYPLAFMAEQIVGDKAEVINLAGASDVHDYEPSPQDMVNITTADLVIFQGAELEAWSEDVIPTLTNATLEVTHDLNLAKAEAHEKHAAPADHEEDEHEDEHHEDEEEHHEDEHEEESHDEHAHGEFDPHTWLDPVLAQDMTDEILEAIIHIDPVNQDRYTAKAQNLKDRFAALNTAFETQLSQCSRDEVIVSHDAYGYLARRYGFVMHAIGGLSTQDEPSAKILAELKAEAEEGITHILVEENSVRRFADTLATETGFTTLPINPLGKGTLDPNKDFFDIMKENLKSLQTALNCQ